MKNFNRGKGTNDRKGGGNFARRDSGARGAYRGADNSPRPARFKAVCAQCGQDCEVPFKPTGDRPVLCSNCFKGKDGFSPKRTNSRDFSSRAGSDRPLYTAVCATCGRSCEVPFKPSYNKPVYCSQCFGKNDGAVNASHDSNHRHNDPADEQFEILSAKLDRILDSLKPAAAPAPAARPEKVRGPKEVDKKPAKKIAAKTKKK